MGGLTGDWERLKQLRDREARKDQDQGQGAAGDAAAPERPEATGEGQEEAPSARPRPRAGRTRGGRRPPPAAADAVPTTIRFDPEEARAVDRFVLELADQAARRTLDKAEVFRELVRLAQEHEPTRKQLLKRLK
ncbi:hypothetical protein CFC35_41995 [Streptomyces sp. FBKL.4005]|nr:hypothetical protein CFC35_41995 [Streptomyces sp. FBKL.4005]